MSNQLLLLLHILDNLFQLFGGRFERVRNRFLNRSLLVKQLLPNSFEYLCYFVSLVSCRLFSITDVSLDPENSVLDLMVHLKCLLLVLSKELSLFECSVIDRLDVMVLMLGLVHDQTIDTENLLLMKAEGLNWFLMLQAHL